MKRSTFQPANAGGSIKPRVERSGTLGNALQHQQAHEMGDSYRPLRGLDYFFARYTWGYGYAFTPGFMLSPALQA